MNNMYDKISSKRLKAVIFDWAGTTVDYGCFAPTGVFTEVFRQKGIEITNREARGPMGMHKRDHIRVVSEYPRVKEEWMMVHGRACTEADIDEMFSNFVPLQMSVIERHSEIVAELPEALKVIRSMKLRIGSTTGYNNEMMKILTEAAAKQGYVPDCVVCATDVPEGRPAPWMALRNAEALGIYPMKSIVKIGDTVSDIKEGVNAGMWSVGVIMSSNEMGFKREDLLSLDHADLDLLKKNVKDTFFQAGAHFVIDTLAETEDLIMKINTRLSKGVTP